jgi:hypothetical protein
MSATGGTQEAGGVGRVRALSSGETIDTAAQLYRKSAVTLWRIVAAVIVPLTVLQVVVRRLTLGNGVFAHNGALYVSGPSGQSSAGGSFAIFLVSFLGLLAQLLATGAVFTLLLDSYLDHPVDWRETFAAARERLWSLVWLGILQTVLVILGFVLLIVPGIWFLVATCVAVPALMAEGLKGWEALRRSMTLVEGRWWATLGRLLVALLLYVGVLFILGLIVGAITRGLSVTNVTLWLVISGALSAIVTIVMTPFIAAVITTVYVDLRVRKEGFSLDSRRRSSSAPGSDYTPKPETPSATADPSGRSVPPPPIPPPEQS